MDRVCGATCAAAFALLSGALVHSLQSSFSRNFRVNGNMSHPSPFVFIAQIAIPKALEQRFTELYDGEHIPALMGVPGVRSCSRLKLMWADTAEMPEYLAIYDVDGPEVPKSPAWQTASNTGRWSAEIRPHMTVRRHGMFERVRTFDPRQPGLDQRRAT